VEAVQNQNAAYQRISAEPVNDRHPRFSCLGDYFERILQGCTVQIHERLHQILGGGSYRGIGNRFYFLDQPADPLHIFPKIPAFRHNAP
jgi:hypothetical protein